MQTKAVMIFLGIALSASRGFEEEDAKGAIAAAQYFVKTDFDAVGDHFGLVRVDPTSSDATGDVAFSCLENSMVVVTSYRVGKCVVGHRKGAIEVSYERVGTIVRGYFRAEKKVRDAVTLGLVYADGQWWILKSGPARVSLGALLACYKESYAELDKAWWARASEAQRAFATRLEKNIAAMSAEANR